MRSKIMKQHEPAWEVHMLAECEILLQRFIEACFFRGHKTTPHTPKSAQAAATQRNAFLSRQQSAPQPIPVSPGGDCVNEQPGVPMATADSSKKAEPRRVGENADSDGGGVIVWEGNVTTRGCVLCKAELVSYGSSVKPGRM